MATVQIHMTNSVMAIFCPASWLPLLIISPLHGFSYHQIATIVGPNHSVYIHAVTMLTVRSWIVYLNAIPWSLSHFVPRLSRLCVASGLA